MRAGEVEGWGTEGGRDRGQCWERRRKGRRARWAVVWGGCPEFEGKNGLAVFTAAVLV